MSSLILPSRFTQQPQSAAQIDRGSPGACGLAAYMPLAGRASPDAVDNVAWTVAASSTPIAFDAAPRGLAMRIKGATPSYVSRPIPASITSSATQPLTMRYRLYFRSIANVSGLMSWGNSPQDGNPRFYARLNAGNLNFFFSGGYHYSVPVLAEREYIVTHDFDGVQHFTYLNGVLVGTAPGAPWTANFASLYLGIGYDGLQASSDFLLSDFALWNRAMTSGEVASDAQNPWLVFAGPQRRIWMVSAGAAPDTPVNPATAGITLTGYAPTVTRTASLGVTPSATALVLTGYAPSVTQSSAATITPSPAAITLTGYAPSVARTANQGVVSGAAQIALTGYAPTVTQAVASANLTPAPTMLVLTGYAPSVTQSSPQAPGSGGGGGGSAREVRAFAERLNQPEKRSRSEKRKRRRELETEALELLPDLPQAEAIAPIIAQLVFEQESRAFANWTPVKAMQPLAFNAEQALRAQIDAWMQQESLRKLIDDEHDLELLLLG